MYLLEHLSATRIVLSWGTLRYGRELQLLIHKITIIDLLLKPQFDAFLASVVKATSMQTLFFP